MRSMLSFIVVMLVSSGLASAPLWAAEPTSAPATKTEPRPATPAAAPAAPAPEAGKRADAPDSPDAAKNAAHRGTNGATDGAVNNEGPSPQRFTPSEQVRADFDVSFPIDI